jgi:hypothetical protein
LKNGNGDDDDENDSHMEIDQPEEAKVPESLQAIVKGTDNDFLNDYKFFPPALQVCLSN